MSLPRWNPPVPDYQMVVEAELENTMRSIVEWRAIPGTTSTVGLDKDGNTVVVGCGRGRSKLSDRDETMLDYEFDSP